MKKANVLHQVATPDGSVMALVERNGQYMLWVNGRELMSTRHAYSEQQLGVVGCQALGQRKRARVLIGGLGLGFTLRAALDHLASDAQVVVAELIADVVTWNQNPAYPLAHAALADRRTELVLGDVAQVITKGVAAFDAILVDADNRTTTMNTAGNSSLYGDAGCARMARALKPNGRVVYWSAADDPQLARQLARAGFGVETLRVRRHATSTSGGYHVLLVGRHLGRADSY